MSDFESRHPQLDLLEPYEPPDLAAAAERAGVEQDELIRLVANENPYGPAPGVVRALAEFEEYHFHPEYESLSEAVAAYARVTPDKVVLSNGADEMIDLLIRLFVEPGEAVVTTPPTFSMYGFYARVNRCQMLTVPLREDFSLDVEAVETAVRRAMNDRAEGTRGFPRVLFLVSPGNPSGRAIPSAAIERLLGLSIMVVVDEAYIEFGGESVVNLLRDHQNLVILRTFSKWAGLAGLRLGYGLMASGLAQDVERIRPPYNVNAAAMVAALATFADMDAVQTNIGRLVEERERLQGALREFPWLVVFPSEANFVLCRVVDREAGAVVDHLLDHGILIRGFTGGRMEDYVRISVGRPKQSDAVLDALEDMG